MIAENLDIPDEFTLLFAEGRRQCRLAWRIGCEFGAQFIDEKTTLRSLTASYRSLISRQRPQAP